MQPSRPAGAFILALAAHLSAAPALPPLEEAITATRDLWGEAALAQPNGPSYEFLAPLLPPPRYVNADFRHYPIILCPPARSRPARSSFAAAGTPARGPRRG